jgi:hypothetical protein
LFLASRPVLSQALVVSTDLFSGATAFPTTASAASGQDAPLSTGVSSTEQAEPSSSDEESDEDTPEGTRTKPDDASTPKGQHATLALTMCPLCEGCDVPGPSPNARARWLRQLFKIALSVNAKCKRMQDSEVCAGFFSLFVWCGRLREMFIHSCRRRRPQRSSSP